MIDREATRFHVELIKPSHYDDDGYVIQWLRAAIPSNSLAALHALVDDVKQRGALGANVDLRITAFDECHTVIPVEDIIRRIRGSGGVVAMVGVQSNQLPRALDLCRSFRAADVPVVMGGFHVSGSLAMLPETPPEIRELQEMGVSIFAGEAEGRMERVLRDALEDRLVPLYDFMNDLPDLGEQITPRLPLEVTQRYMAHFTSFDAGRGCPFQCSFCTIINVQGRKSRHRSADDVERLVRQAVANGIKRFFITDDNFARNRNWEEILDRLIEMRQKERIRIKFVVQVDTLCHRIPGFIEKCKQAGCNRVFLGLENINPTNLAAAQKNQNRITEYRHMLQAWRNQGIVTYAGYILGFPQDTPESIARDIEIIKRELPIDILEFFVLTPLPGSEDHQRLHREGIAMDPDLNKYDLEHVTTDHPIMSRAELDAVYDRSWHQFYDWKHIETLLRRAEAQGGRAGRISAMVAQFYGSYRYERVHPLQSGLGRRKRRRSRRHGMPLENPLLFHPRRWWEIASTYTRFGAFYLRLHRLRRRVEREALEAPYTDLAITPLEGEELEKLEMCQVTAGAEKAVAKARNLSTPVRAAEAEA